MRVIQVGGGEPQQHLFKLNIALFSRKNSGLNKSLKKCFPNDHLPPGNHRHCHRFSKNVASYKCLFAIAFFLIPFKLMLSMVEMKMGKVFKTSPNKVASKKLFAANKKDELEQN